MMKTLSLFLLAALAAHAVEPTLLRLPEGAMQPRVAPVSDGSHAIVFCTGDPKAGDIQTAIISADGKLGPATTVSTAATQAVVMGTVRGPSIAVGAQDT